MQKDELILVTGAAGFIGFHTVKYLIKNGYKVIGVDNLNDYYDVNLKVSRLKQLQKIINASKRFQFVDIVKSSI